MRIIHMQGQAKKNNARRSRLERVASQSAPPNVRIDWTKKELVNLAERLSSEPAKPTEALIRLMRG